MNKYKSLRINGIKYDEHRMIIENYLGRKLNRNEVVHHINGDKSDNRIENLKVMSLSEHTKLHMKNRKISLEVRNKISKSSIGKINSKRTFDENTVFEIYKKHSQGTSNRKIAKLYGVSRATIDCIINGKLYKEIYAKYNKIFGNI